jgi:flagellar motor protein MotB
MAHIRPIVIVKKKAAHGGHHGGAWKVAYADFVTAMMALFIVLWLLNSSKQIREAVGGYFKHLQAGRQRQHRRGRKLHADQRQHEQAQG